IKHVIARAELADRFAAISGDYQRISVGGAEQGGAPEGWIDLAGAMDASPDFEPSHTTHADDTLPLYFTSGTTSNPKLGEPTSTSTSPRPAGPSTPGPTCSPRGSPAPACSSTTTPASTRRR